MKEFNIDACYRIHCDFPEGRLARMLDVLSVMGDVMLDASGTPNIFLYADFDKKDLVKQVERICGEGEFYIQKQEKEDIDQREGMIKTWYYERYNAHYEDWFNKSYRDKLAAATKSLKKATAHIEELTSQLKK